MKKNKRSVYCFQFPVKYPDYNDHPGSEPDLQSGICHHGARDHGGKMPLRTGSGRAYFVGPNSFGQLMFSCLTRIVAAVMVELARMTATITENRKPKTENRKPKLEAISFELLVVLFFTGLVAGTLDSIAGGGGLIAFPVILATGMSPVQALATNKLQGSFGTTTAAIHFMRHGHINHQDMLFTVACTFIGATLGSYAVSRIDNQALLAFIPVLLVANAVYFLVSPRVGDIERHKRVSMRLFALVIGGGIGFYDGFFGPGTGAFFALACVSLLGYSMTRATAYTKVLNMTSNLAALLFFIYGNYVVWSVGLVMAAGQVLGSTLGAHLVIRRGTALIRPLLVLVSIALTIKLVINDPDNPIRQFIGF